MAVFAIPTSRLQAQDDLPAPKATTGRVADRLNFANRLLRDRRYDLAADEYEAILGAGPTTAQAADARFGLATARWFLGQYQVARQQFEQFLKDAPEHANAATAWFRVGESAYLLGDLPAASKALEGYLGHQGDHRFAETAWTYLGEIRYRQSEFPAAKESYEKALSTGSNNPLVDRARYGLARTLFAQKDYAGAQDQLEKVVTHGSRDWTDKARLQMGLVDLASDKPAEALTVLEAMERDAPKSPLVPEARLRRAEALNRLGRPAEAEELLKPLVASEGNVAAQAAFALASADLKQNRPDDALAVCDEALKRFADTPVAPLLWYRSAEAAAVAGRIDEALKRYLKVVEGYPKDDWAADALLRAAELALKGGRLPRARELAAAFPQRFPSSPLRPNARLVEAQAALADQDAKGAIPLLESLLDQKLGADLETSVRLALGVAYRTVGQGDKAQKVLGDVAKTKPEAQYVVGVGHYDAHRYAEAVPALQAYLAARPKGDVAAEALALLAISQQELGRSAEAKQALDQLAAEAPTSKALLQARLRLGETALDSEQFDQASELLRAAADTATEPPAKTRALWGLGWAQLDGGHPADAVTTFDTLIKAAPQDALAADAAVARARALDESGKANEALAAYDQAITTYAKNERVVTSATLARARLLDHEGRHDEAAEAFGRYLHDHPQPPPSGDPTDAVLADYGWALLDAGKRSEAVTVFQRILDEFPHSPRAVDARVMLADAAHVQGKHDEVETLLAPVIGEGSRADPQLIQTALFRLGLSRFDRREWARATEAFDRLLNEYLGGPLAAKARFWKAETAFQSGDPKLAEAEFAAILKASRPANSDDWFPTARLRHIESLVALERWSEVLSEADALKADQPKFAAMHELEYARGRAFLGLARFDEARAAFQAVIEANKADDFAARAQLMRGETFFHQQKYNEALKEYLRVVYNDKAPALQVAALLEAGKIAEQLQRWSDAADFYNLLMTKHADDPLARTASERLEAIKPKLAPRSP